MAKLQKLLNKAAIKLRLKKKPGVMSNEEIAQDRSTYNALNKDSRFQMNTEYDYICAHDKYAENGSIDDGYFVQDIWGARKVLENKPAIHYDVGSSVASFIAHLLAMKQKITLLDIRPMSNNLNTTFLNDGGGGVTYIQTNATNLKELESSSIQSLSALCSVEHFGLGRYGDPIEPDAWEKALKAFQRVLQKGGKLYISVPVSPINKLCFNAHRVYNPFTIIETLDCMQLVEFGYIDNFDIQFGVQQDLGLDKLTQEFIDSIPTFTNNGLTGLFEFVKVRD